MPNFGLIINRESDNGTGTKMISLYTYNNYNQLIELKSADTTTTYQYNANGYRVEKNVNGKTTRYLYEGDKVVLETDGNNVQRCMEQIYYTEK